MTTELFLDFLGIRVDSNKAEGMKFSINLVTPDNDEKFVVEMSNATLTTIAGQQAENPDLTVTINRSDLEAVMMGTVSFDDQIKAGKAKLEGNRDVFDQLRSTLVQFEMGFELMPGTKEPPPRKKMNPFEQTPPANTAGG